MPRAAAPVDPAGLRLTRLAAVPLPQARVVSGPPACKVGVAYLLTPGDAHGIGLGRACGAEVDAACRSPAPQTGVWSRLAAEHGIAHLLAPSVP